MSRYEKTEIIEEGDKKYYGLWERPEFKTFLEEEYTVVQGDTLDLISYKIYGREDWYYAIAAANDIIHPFDDLKIGMKLKIPAIEEILKFEGQL